MEQNKPLSVHMTHEEYENYKKFLALKGHKEYPVFWGYIQRFEGNRLLLEQYYIWSDNEVHSFMLESYVQSIDSKSKEIERLNTEMDRLNKEIYTLKTTNKPWYKFW